MAKSTGSTTPPFLHSEITQASSIRLRSESSSPKAELFRDLTRRAGQGEHGAKPVEGPFRESKKTIQSSKSTMPKSQKKTTALSNSELIPETSCATTDKDSLGLQHKPLRNTKPEKTMGTMLGTMFDLGDETATDPRVSPGYSLKDLGPTRKPAPATRRKRPATSTSNGRRDKMPDEDMASESRQGGGASKVQPALPRVPDIYDFPDSPVAPKPKQATNTHSIGMDITSSPPIMGRENGRISHKPPQQRSRTGLPGNPEPCGSGDAVWPPSEKEDLPRARLPSPHGRQDTIAAAALEGAIAPETSSVLVNWEGLGPIEISSDPDEDMTRDGLPSGPIGEDSGRTKGPNHPLHRWGDTKRGWPTGIVQPGNSNASVQPATTGASRERDIRTQFSAATHSPPVSRDPVLSPEPLHRATARREEKGKRQRPQEIPEDSCHTSKKPRTHFLYAKTPAAKSAALLDSPGPGPGLVQNEGGRANLSGLREQGGIWHTSFTQRLFPEDDDATWLPQTAKAPSRQSAQPREPPRELLQSMMQAFSVTPIAVKVAIGGRAHNSVAESLQEPNMAETSTAQAWEDELATYGGIGQVLASIAKVRSTVAECIMPVELTFA